MSTRAIREALAALDGPNHHDRDALLARNGRWGTCSGCPRDADGRARPEQCEYTSRADHNLRRPTHDAWSELEAIERAAKVLDALQSGEPYDEAERGTAYRLMESIAKEAP